MEFSNKLYDILKWLCLIFFPALCVLLSTLLPALGVDGETVKTIVLIVSAVATFIGTLIGVSTAAYRTHEQENK